MVKRSLTDFMPYFQQVRVAEHPQNIGRTLSAYGARKVRKSNKGI
jgi:hypothetical protein